MDDKVNNGILLCLKSRSFRLKVEGRLSNRGLLCSGALEGHELGPLIFRMYVNDMANASENPCLKFTDDIEQLGSASSKTIQKDLNKIYQWSLR